MSQHGVATQKPGTTSHQVSQPGQHQGQKESTQKSNKEVTQTPSGRQPSSLLQNLALGASAITNCLNHDHSWPELGDILTRKFGVVPHYARLKSRRRILLGI